MDIVLSGAHAGGRHAGSVRVKHPAEVQCLPEAFSPTPTGAQLHQHDQQSCCWSEAVS